MIEWWDVLTGLERFFALTAIPATLILIIQTLMSLFGLGDHDHDTELDNDLSGLDHGDGVCLECDHVDVDHDVSLEHDHHFDKSHEAPDHDHGLRIFTLRGIVAFFSIFGWVGLTVAQADISPIIVVLVALIAGFLAMLGIALLFRAAFRLQSNGSMDLRNAFGLRATVYIRVPAKRTAHGKVNLIVQENYIEADAVTDEEYDLPTGSEVVVIGMINPHTVLVAVR